METSSQLTGTVAAETARQAISSNRPNGTYIDYIGGIHYKKAFI